MLQSAADRAVQQAIRAQDFPAFQAWIQKNKVTCNLAWLATDAMRWGDPRVVTLVGGYFSGPALTMALNLALEAGQEDQATLLMEAAQRRPRVHGRPALDLHQALFDAITGGQRNAMHALLLRGASAEGMVALRLEPLEGAASHNRLAMLTHWLPHFPAAKDRDNALYAAAEANAPEALFHLWPVATPDARRLAVHAVAQGMLKREHQDWANTLDALLPLLSSDESMSSSFHEAITRVFVLAIHDGDWARAARQVPWLAPDMKQALPLRLAVENHRPELVAALLPRTQVALARQAWTQARPPRWDWVDALATQVSPELRQVWLNDKKNTERLPRALAATRQDQALTEAPAPARARPRRRS